MFQSLTERLSNTMRTLAGTHRISEKNIKDALIEVRNALLDADVALPVVKAFLEQVKIRAVGQEVIRSLTPGQALIKVVKEEIESVMGKANVPLAKSNNPPTVILLAGLQGAGKTTTAAKLAKYLTTTQKQDVLMVSVDVYRPAAILQLQTLAKDLEVDCLEVAATDKPQAIAKAALQEAKKRGKDYLIIDTAGRSHIDEAMMNEVKEIHHAVSPDETLFVVDSMTGQDAANSAKAFHEALPLTGVVLTKTDGDARGGAALSIRHITGKPIKFMGISEKPDGLQPFHPERVASRILGMGDILSLVEEAEQKVDKEVAGRMAKKIMKGQGFDLDDMRLQISEMKKMGGMAGILDKMPGMSGMASQMKDKVNDQAFNKTEVIISSMTMHERHFPQVINGSRKKRIAAGSGATIQDVNRVLKQHEQMAKVMKKMSKKGGMSKMLKQLKHVLPGGLPKF